MKTLLASLALIPFFVHTAAAQAAETAAQQKFRKEATDFVVATMTPLCEATVPPKFCITGEGKGPFVFWHPNAPKRLSVEVLMQGLDTRQREELEDAMKRVVNRFAIAHNKEFSVQFSLANTKKTWGDSSQKIGITKERLQLLMPPHIPADPP